MLVKEREQNKSANAGGEAAKRALYDARMARQRAQHKKKAEA